MSLATSSAQKCDCSEEETEHNRVDTIVTRFG